MLGVDEIYTGMHTKKCLTQCPNTDIEAHDGLILVIDA